MDFATINQAIQLISAILSGFAASIAIYLFVFKRKSISSIFHLLVIHALKITLTELETKIELLNELTAKDEEQREEIINIFNEILGQMNGNKILREKCEAVLSKISKYAEKHEELTEPMKRNLVHELRENLRTIDIQTYNKIIKREYYE